MHPLPSQPGLTEQVYQALVDAICDGTLAPESHLVQERLAATLGVSRQPVQQALAILKNEGMVQELGGRGLFVAPLHIGTMRHHYEIRRVLDGLAARLAAEQAAASLPIADEIARAGAARLAAGERAVAGENVAEMVQRDVEFHEFLYEASGNPLLAATAAPHWRYLRRAMSDVLRRAEPPVAIWRQHADILAAVVAGDATRAETLAAEHVARASERLAAALAPGPHQPAAESPGTKQAIKGGRDGDAGRSDTRRGHRRAGPA